MQDGESELELIPASRSGARSSSWPKRKLVLGAVAIAGAALLGLAAVLGFRGGGSKLRAGGSQQAAGGAVQLYSPQESGNTEFKHSIDGLPGFPLLFPTTPKPGTPHKERAVVNSLDCQPSEEFFAGACYQNCSVLTQGRFPIRSSPNHCCRKEPCLFPSDLDFEGPFVCQGYAVDYKGDCPRSPGKCAPDEEMFGGMCFKTCNSLTNGGYPYRISSTGCCRKDPPCWNFWSDVKVDMGIGDCSGFSVGGSSSSHGCPTKPNLG
eukprot:TRINITY_DN2653_c0_g1_i1.p1 TRINITY_DN2653_c0_g1~~TRINITY_DN2653_c0_g1_i1.p1  ORF type:complete len:287 (-),score=36.55 TRINITY_DN2653_c0_g1_i1:45-836(-)